MVESYKLIKANGDELEFDSSGYNAVTIDGLGNPNIEYTTQATFFTDGEVVTNFVVNPRQLSIHIVGQNNAQSRMDWWNLRAEILAFVTPLDGPYRFVFTNDDHIVYELGSVYPTNGLVLGSNTYNESRNDGRIDDNMKLTAYDPIWKVTPIETTNSVTPTIGSDLIFPMTFPFLLGASGAVFDQSISYTGTWKSYPKLTINGPYNTATLTNKATSAVIQLIRPISAGDTRVIDLSDPLGGFTVTDSSGNNKMGEINIDTNFTQFFFDPSKTNGVDGVLLGGTIGDSRLTIEHHTTFLGI